MALADLTVTSERSKVIQFSSPIESADLTIVIRVRKHVQSLDQFCTYIHHHPIYALSSTSNDNHSSQPAIHFACVLDTFLKSNL